MSVSAPEEDKEQVEGLCFRRLDEPYGPGARSWRKHRTRLTTEAAVSAVTGSVTAPGDASAGALRPGGAVAVRGPYDAVVPSCPWRVAAIRPYRGGSTLAPQRLPTQMCA